MVKRKVYFTLDCAKPGNQYTVEGLHVGDKRSCEFHILLRNGIVPLSFDDESLAVMMNAQKPDGTTISSLCEISEDKKEVVYTLDVQDTVVAGVVNYELIIAAYDGENYCILYSAMFSTVVSTGVIVPVFRELDSEPADWATGYKKYFRHTQNGYEKITDDTCPTFNSNDFYFLVNPNYDSENDYSAFEQTVANVQSLLLRVGAVETKNAEQDTTIGGKAAADHTHSEYVTDNEMQEALANIDFDASKAVRAFNGENDEIIKYLSKEPQTDAAYANSNVNTQITERWDIPGSLAIDVPTNTACFRIVDCKSGNEWKEEVSGASFVLKNLIPGRIYRYYALKADDSVLGSGCCTARGQVRMIDVPKSDGTRNVFNIRDIGGWACDGGRIKYGLIFRGSRLNGANSNVTDSTITLDNSQIAYFKDILNIKYEIDLRSTSEAAEQEGSVLGDGVGYMRQYIKYYQQSIQDNGAQYKALIEQVADNLNAGKVTYIHCASGADRTGQLCFFIEAICGVSLVNIENDYELTYYAFEYKSGIVDRRRNKITNACWKLFIDELNNETGSTIQEKAVNYLLGKGVTTATIGIIREKLIEHCVPTRTSQLENDSGFLTAQDISGKVNYVEVQRDDVNQNEVDSCINENTIYHVYVRSSVVAHGWTKLLCVKHQSYVVQYALTSSRYIIIRRGSISNGVITWDETWRNVENASNKVTSISSASTDSQYPTAKAVYDKILNQMLTLTEVRASYAGAAGETPRYKPGKWLVETGAAPVEGNIYTIKIPGTGTTSGQYMSVHGTADTDYYPIVIGGTGRLTTQFGAGVVITVIYETNKTVTVYELESTTTNNSTYAYTGNVFRVLNYYDSGNTNTLLRTYALSVNKEFPLIGVATAASTTNATPATHTSSYKDVYGAIPSAAANKATINLSTGKITVPGGIAGNLDGTASAAPWSGVTGKPTTLSGYGITDAYTKAEVDSAIQTAIGGIENGSY